MGFYWSHFNVVFQKKTYGANELIQDIRILLRRAYSVQRKKKDLLVSVGLLEQCVLMSIELFNVYMVDKAIPPFRLPPSTVANGMS